MTTLQIYEETECGVPLRQCQPLVLMQRSPVLTLLFSYGLHEQARRSSTMLQLNPPPPRNLCCFKRLYKDSPQRSTSASWKKWHSTIEKTQKSLYNNTYDFRARTQQPSVQTQFLYLYTTLKVQPGPTCPRCLFLLS